MTEYIHLPKRIFLLLLLAVLAFVFEPAAAVPNDDLETDENEPFRQSNWTITIPLWLPGYRGQFAIGDIDVDGEPGDGEGGGEDGIFWRLFYPRPASSFFSRVK